jgi:hypothetical protein
MEHHKRVTLNVWIDPRWGARASLRLEAHRDVWNGWSWYGAADELTRWLRGNYGAIMDGYYMGRLCFERLETWRHEDAGDRPQMRGYCAQPLPMGLAERLADAVELWALLAHAGIWPREDRIEVDITEAWDQMVNLYGVGKGSVRVEYSSPECEQAVAALRRESESFARRFDSIVTIAQNTTVSREEVATARIMSSWGGEEFAWQAGGLYGGLVNHGGEWGLHT